MCYNRSMKRFIKKLFHVILIIQAYLFRNECAFLRIVEREAMDYLETCKKIDVRSTEEIEDLLFHIKAYFDIPAALRTTTFQDIPAGLKFRVKKNIPSLAKKYKNLVGRYTDYLMEIEKQRAVERLCIIECLKSFPFSTVI